MSEQTFEELFEQSLENTKMHVGDIVEGEIVNIDNKFVLVDIGGKSAGSIPIEQFSNEQISIGDKTEVALEMFADPFGETRLSREKARRLQALNSLIKKYDANETVSGLVSGRIKGGFVVEIEGIRAFLPGSLIDIRPVSDTSWLEGNTFDFKIIKIDRKRNNIVVSRRAALKTESAAERAKVLESLEEGKKVKGIVKNITNYGAFIDLGGVDGLLHITDISWKRVKSPAEILKVGQEIEVLVLKFDREKGRVSLGLKQLNEDPWDTIKENHPIGSKFKGKVTNITEYGCFVEIAPGIEGLVHMSEMDWTNKNIRPNKLVNVGDEVEVMVLDIDEERRRISLGMKQCKENPWGQFASKHQIGEHIKSTVKSITDFGLFLGLEGEIDGLVHLSDISWYEPGEKAIHQYKKGDEIEAVILAIDPERERISLGIKQLEGNPFNNYVEANPKGSVVKGKVIELNEKQAMVELSDNVIGHLNAAEASKEKISNLNEILNVGDEVEAKIININRKDETISLSIKAKDIAEQKKVMKKMAEEAENTPTLGDVFKEQLN
ncbi:MAG: 30S ribosomal protein S1 [Gammaproteobacteria bacterium]|nr:30S ribosomal protein S1 [Gammaproteobacteria bacterium]